ncbi:Outer membrane protein beta-barrel domain-containing protein [Hyphomicrobium sp. 1Nfss2.1]|uniref:hypothetical protein n=1 Tax=Hyphomicrobium sp. 1Nfss2.1 TaxID=3413936 RepID=UPI003C7C138C
MRVPMFMSVALAIFATAARADGTPQWSAQTSPIKPGPSGWHFKFTPYAWLPWIDGDATVKGRDFSINQNPGQVLSSLDFAWMSYQEARRGAITLFSDVMFTKNSDSDSFARSHQFSAHVEGSVGAALSADYKQWIVEFGGMYETNRWRMSPGPGEADTTLDLLVGGRYWHQELDVDLSLDGTLDIRNLVIERGIALARSGGVDWVDPFLGARIVYQHSPTDSFVFRGDIGGFSVGSKLTWQAIATYNFYLGSHAAIDFDGYLGYRALSVNYVQGSGIDRYEFDVVQQGPVVGITGKF